MNRTYHIGTPGRATFALAESDDMTGLDPRERPLVAFESEVYPLPWVGEVVDMTGRPAAGEVEFSARGFEALLGERLLPTTFTLRGTAGSMIERLVEEIERTNPLGLQLPNEIASGPTLDELAFGDRTLLDAVQLVARVSGHEWWLEHEVVRGEIVTSLQFRQARGQDRTHVVLVGGPRANVEVMGWRVNTEGTAHRVRAVAGQSSATQAFSARARVERRLSASSPVAQALLVSAPVTRHGYTFGRFPTGDSILSRAEQLAVLEGVRGEGALAIAAEHILTSGRRPERSIELVYTGGFDTWPDLLPGDVVLADIPAPVFVRGFRGPVQILATRPMEQLGRLHLVAEVPGDAD